MNKLLRELPHNRRERIGRRVVVHGLRERDEDGGDAELVVREVLHDVRIEAEHAELVPAHDAREELHEEDLVVERETLVVPAEDIVELLAEGLGIVEELEGGEIGRDGFGFAFSFLRGC